MNTAITAENSSTKGAGPSGTGNALIDGIELLIRDHKEVKTLFKQYDELVEGNSNVDERERLAEKICVKLRAHTSVEEELFYPAARDALAVDAELVDEAEVEHASAKELIAQIQSSSATNDRLFDAKVKVLGEYVDHHVREEEGEMFPKVKESGLDLGVLGQQMAERKEELLKQLGGADGIAT